MVTFISKDNHLAFLTKSRGHATHCVGAINQLCIANVRDQYILVALLLLYLHNCLKKILSFVLDYLRNERIYCTAMHRSSVILHRSCVMYPDLRTKIVSKDSPTYKHRC